MSLNIYLKKETLNAYYIKVKKKLRNKLFLEACTQER